MSHRTFVIDGIGEVKIFKRRNNRNLRVSLSTKGHIRVSIPAWVPYHAGVSFAKQHQAWIKNKQSLAAPVLISEGMIIGKSHRISFQIGPGISSKITDSNIVIQSEKPIDDPETQAEAVKACEKALRLQANDILPDRVKQLAAEHDFSYSNLKIRKLTSRWGSCSSKQVITLSYLLMQLPWPLIDYVIVHELIHTRHLHHGPDFWAGFETIIPDAKQKRKEIRQFHPQLLPI